MAAELGAVLPGGDLQLVPADPLGHPAHAAVARQEAPAQAQAPDEEREADINHVYYIIEDGPPNGIRVNKLVNLRQQMLLVQKG